MNTKAEKFKAYADKVDPQAFVADEIKDDTTMHTVIFRSGLEVKGQRLPLLVFIDDSVYVIIRVFLASHVVHDMNRKAVYDFLNEANRQYKIFKFYTTEEGDIVLDTCIPSADDSFSPDMIDAIIRQVTYPYLNDNLMTILEKI